MAQCRFARVGIDPALLRGLCGHLRASRTPVLQMVRSPPRATRHPPPSRFAVNYSLSHLSDDSLLRGLATLVAQDRITTADMLAHIAEVDERRLYAPAGYPSMYAYCVGELRLSEDAAARRIQVARIARRFPSVFEAIARGRPSVTAVGLLAPHLVEHTASELLTAAEHKSKVEIERMLAERFPKSDLLSWVAAMPASEPASAGPAPAPARVDDSQVVATSGSARTQFVPERVECRARVTPLSARSYALQATIDPETQDY